MICAVPRKAKPPNRSSISSTLPIVQAKWDEQEREREQQARVRKQVQVLQQQLGAQQVRADAENAPHSKRSAAPSSNNWKPG